MDNSESRHRVVSIVVPCFNEEDVIATTYRSVLSALEVDNEVSFELVFVDDGSSDSTLTILKTIQATDARVRVVALSRNFGHQMAVTAGIEHASGNAVVLIDADLQDPPEVINEMIARWHAGVDVAYGSRMERDGETPFKRWTAKMFYRSINRISDVPIPLDTGDFRLMDRKVVDALLELPERDRFIRGMVAWLGFRQEPVLYKRAARVAGHSKYPLKRMVRFAMDGVLSFSLLPLRIAIWLGFATASLAMAATIYALIVRLLTRTWVPGWTFLLIAISSIGGIQLICMGVVGEYVGRVYGESKRRPLYVLRERLGFSSHRTARGYERKGIVEAERDVRSA